MFIKTNKFTLKKDLFYSKSSYLRDSKYEKVRIFQDYIGILVVNVDVVSYFMH